MTPNQHTELQGPDRRGTKVGEPDVSWLMVKIACAFVLAMALVGSLIITGPS